MSYLNKVNLEETTAFRDNNVLTPIPEDQSNSIGGGTSSLTSPERQENGNNSSRRQGRRWETASSTVAVVEEIEQPSLSRPSGGTNQRQKQTRWVCNSKYVILLLVLIVGVAIGIYFVVDGVTGSDGPTQPSPSPSLGATPQPSVRLVDDDFLPTDSPSSTSTDLPSAVSTLSPEDLSELDAVFEDVAGPIEADSPQALARSWFLTDSAAVTVATDGTYRVIQRYVLAILYYMWGGDLLPNYLTDQHECDWDGVFCDELMAIGLSLRDLNLQGPLPSELPQLTTLQGISLGNNSLTGTIPDSWWGWDALAWFDVSVNRISGQLSPEVWTMESLLVLNLADNRISGTLPDLANGTSTSLQGVNLGLNQLTGTLPASLMNWGTLEVLYLNGNNFTGTLPNISSSALNDLRLYENFLTGSIPSSFGQLQNLEELNLYGNNLTSSIPMELFELPNLKYIDLSENNFTGALESMPLAPSLEYMYFSNNSLTGVLPAVLPLSIKQAWFSSNLFSGPIPTEIGVRNENLTMLLIQNNLLEGTVPMALCERKLRQLEADCLANNTNFVECACCTECF